MKQDLRGMKNRVILKLQLNHRMRGLSQHSSKTKGFLSLDKKWSFKLQKQKFFLTEMSHHQTVHPNTGLTEEDSFYIQSLLLVSLTLQLVLTNVAPWARLDMAPPSICDSHTLKKLNSYV